MQEIHSPLLIEATPPIDEITLRTPGYLVYRAITREYITYDNLRQYFEINATKLGLNEVGIEEKAFSALDIVRSPVYKTRFIERHWPHETHPDWENRSPKEAMYEAIAHSITSLKHALEYFIMSGKNIQKLPIESLDQAEALMQQMEALGSFYTGTAIEYLGESVVRVYAGKQ